jgi:5-methylcytosine-specific restriction endonuclease McrA
MIQPCIGEPFCANPAVYRGRCQRHAREAQRIVNEKRALQRKVYSSKRWKMVRRRHLFNNPLCDCGAIATDVHHIKDLRDGGEPYDASNLQALCAVCHSRITKARS